MTWLDTDPHVSLGGAAAESAQARIVRYRLNDVTIDVDSPAPAFLRLADLWYPDWVATVDGQPVSILRADYLLRAVPVPAGHHRVEFRFQSKAVSVGLALSVVGLVIALALLLAGVGLRRRAPAVAAKAA